jgi:hypothetical protein
VQKVKVFLFQRCGQHKPKPKYVDIIDFHINHIHLENQLYSLGRWGGLKLMPFAAFSACRYNFLFCAVKMHCKARIVSRHMDLQIDIYIYIYIYIYI